MRPLSYIASRAKHIILAFFVLLFSVHIFAQTSAVSLRGQVSDPSGAVIPGATVTARSSSGQPATVKTNRVGSYEFRGLAPGSYTVSVSAKSFADSQKEVQVAAGKEQKLDVQLEIAVEKQQVEVADEGPNKVSLGPENNATATVIKGKDLEALSDDPDELSSELQALAGPSAGPNGGQIYIDGFSGGTLPPKASIREIRVNQNPFSAQYDRLGYGRVEIFTKPGTDKFHGQIMFRDNAPGLSAPNPFAFPFRPTYDAQQVEGNIGGPLGKKASFFINAERRNSLDHKVVSAYLTQDANHQPIRFTQIPPNPSVGMEISPRFDYQVTANNTLTSRFEYNRSHTIGDGVGGFSLADHAYNGHNSEINAQVSDTQIINTRIVNETRFQFVRSINSQKALNFSPEISVSGAFVRGGNSIGRSSNSQDHYEIQNYTSMALGNHFIRFGGRVRTTAETDSQISGFNGTYSFSSLDAYLANQPISFTIIRGQPLVSNTFVDVGLYAEEDWKMRPDLMVSYGMRFETQNDIHDHADFAPRIGIAWAPGGTKNASPKTVFRAGFGIFYDRFGQGLILQTLRQNGINQQQYVVDGRTASGAAILANYPVIPNISLLAASQGITIRQIDSKLRAPYIMQNAATVERQLSRTANVSVTYLHSRGVHQFFSRNINAAWPGTYNPAVRGSGSYPLVKATPVYQYESDGIFNQNQLITNFNVRGRRLSLFGFYMLNFVKGNTSGAGSFPSNPYSLAQDYGRLAYDIRHRLFFGGTLTLPYGFRFNPIMQVNSGAPFNITLGNDLIGDSIYNQRPAFATSSSQNVKPTRWGTFDLNPQPGEQIPINFGTGPARYGLNLRLSKTFGFGGSSSAQTGPGGRGGFGGPGGGGPRMGGGGEGRGGGGGGEGPRIFMGGPGGGGGEQRYNLTFAIGTWNLLNHVNRADPIGNLSSSTFGQSNGLALGGQFAPGRIFAVNRRVDLQVNFSF